MARVLAVSSKLAMSEPCCPNWGPSIPRMPRRSAKMAILATVTAASTGADEPSYRAFASFGSPRSFSRSPHSGWPFLPAWDGTAFSPVGPRCTVMFFTLLVLTLAVLAAVIWERDRNPRRVSDSQDRVDDRARWIPSVVTR